MIETVYSKLITLLIYLFDGKNVDADVLRYCNIVDDLEIDSIMFIALVVEIENCFKITISDDLLWMDNFMYLDDIVAMIEHELSENCNM